MARLDPSGIIFSIVIPTYCETARLKTTLEELIPFLTETFPQQFEILIVDDPARDGTYTQISTPYNQDPRVRLLRQPTRLGKGVALRRALLESQGKSVLFMDADYATPIQEIFHFIVHVKSARDAIIVSGVRAYQENESKNRRIIGICAQLLFHIVIFKKAVPDSQCGFKLFTREAINLVVPYCRTSGGMIDAELFFLAQKFGVCCRFEPIHWANKAGSKINILKCLMVDTIEIFKIRLRSIFKIYEAPLKEQPWLQTR